MWDRHQILDRLDVLRRADPSLERFGAAAHRYSLNPSLAASEVAAFETLHGVSLPEEYRRFVIKLGDGGAGPFYGLFRLDRSDLPDRLDDDRIPGFLAGSFPHDRAWNPLADDPSYGENEYFDPAQIAGSLALSHVGCGYLIRLVLNGDQRGTLWEDARGGDMGIRPVATSFTRWYLTWLTADHTCADN